MLTTHSAALTAHSAAPFRIPGVCGHARYTLDSVSRNLVFDKTDASLLGCGSSAVVYKGMLDDRPVALKVDAKAAFARA